MLTHEGGRKARGGFYWNVRGWSIVTVPRGGGALPGDRDSHYLRLPVVVLLALAPVMGGLYVMFLPFIGFAMVLAFAGRRTVEAAARALAGLMATVSPAWRPGEAYFAGKGTEPGAEDARPETEAEPLARLEREIDDRRQSG